MRELGRNVDLLHTTMFRKVATGKFDLDLLIARFEHQDLRALCSQLAGRGDASHAGADDGPDAHRHQVPGRQGSHQALRPLAGLAQRVLVGALLAQEV